MTKTQLLSYWKTNLESSGLQDHIKSAYLAYVTVLVEKGVPVIFDFEHLSLLLGRSRLFLASVINAGEQHYRIFKMPKRKGGFREITAPYPALLECQYWIYRNILSEISIHPAAQGFTSKKSIISNSVFHVDRKEFLKIDLKDFFPTITINRVIPVFRKLGYSQKVSVYLAKICCLNDVLPQGAPTSPILSNIIAHQMDRRLLAFARSLNLNYTRYADDLAFSGDLVNSKMLTYIENIVADCGFVINKSKTLLQRHKGKRILTGISISGRQIKIPRAYKRRLKQEIHFVRQYGLTSHVLKLKIKHPNYLFSLIGKVNFWLQVEPNNEFAKNSLMYLAGLASRNEG